MTTETEIPKMSPKLMGMYRKALRAANVNIAAMGWPELHQAYTELKGETVEPEELTPVEPEPTPDITLDEMISELDELGAEIDDTLAEPTPKPNALVEIKPEPEAAMTPEPIKQFQELEPEALTASITETLSATLSPALAEALAASISELVVRSTTVEHKISIDIKINS